ncbi:DUF4157 domain-containing protein [Streptomyces sp. NPDC046977]|uniref:eCIS core domain-containing protein n=1 Tax=Streptomyces sp. NPDC046977 TaxID=3154703 RepID=UPI0033EEEFB2
MHEHEHDGELATGSRLKTDAASAAAPDPLLLKAAAGGRADVLGASGLLRLQRSLGNSAVGAALDDRRAEEPSSVHDVIGSGGRPLDPEVRGDMEARLGHDFGDVRVHTDSAAHDSARAVNAHAYTVGSHVVFQRDAYDPSSHQGRTTLAHELTHVVQQRSGPVDGTETAGGIRVSDPSDRFEREAAANADRVMAQPAPAAPAVQREVEEPEEDSLQGLFVQRTEETAEEETPAE